MALRWELGEEHWSFMDRYAGAMLVRRWRNMLGRTMWDFAGEVSGDRPYARAGLYDIIEVHSWQFGGRAAGLAVPQH